MKHHKDAPDNTNKDYLEDASLWKINDKDTDNSVLYYPEEWSVIYGNTGGEMNKKITFEQKKALVTISKRCLEEYEKVRAYGVVDMYNYYGVNAVANINDYDELANISYEEYKILLMNFQFLMRYYDIKEVEKEIE